jgi:hypothetical protein
MRHSWSKGCLTKLEGKTFTFSQPVPVVMRSSSYRFCRICTHSKGAWSAFPWSEAISGAVEYVLDFAEACVFVASSTTIPRKSLLRPEPCIIKFES